MCATFLTSTPKLGQPPPSILCVDDSRETLEISRIILEAAGYQVFTTTNSAAALGLLQTHPINAVVIDVMMPGMSGTELAREIKHTAANVRVVVYSGSLRGDESFPFVDACLSKGSGPLALRKLIGLLLQK